MCWCPHIWSLAASRLRVSIPVTSVVDGMNYSSQQRKPPLVRYSTQNRAILLSSSVNSMPKARRTRAASARRRPRRKRSQVATSRRGGGNKVRIVKGRVVVKVGGYPGTHRFGAGQLIRFVPLNKIKLAAKRILGSSGRLCRRRKTSKRLKNRRRR